MPKVSPTEEVTTGRTGRVRRVTASIAEINVVPLVDVMLVLLIIFMVTAPMLQRGVDVNLPVARRVRADRRGARVRHRAALVPAGPHGAPRRRAGPVDVLAERIRQMMDGRADRSLPARRRRHPAAGTARGHGPAQGSRRREGRHRRAAARGALSDGSGHRRPARARARTTRGLPRMVTASLVGHVALIAVLVAASAISRPDAAKPTFAT